MFKQWSKFFYCYNCFSKCFFKCFTTSHCYSWCLLEHTTKSTIANNNKFETGEIGSFLIDIDGLLPETKYYYRSFVTTKEATVYGNEYNFVTKSISIAVLTTDLVNYVTQQTATGGGNITYDGGVPITARGICWSTTSNPTIANSFTTDGPEVANL